MPTDVTRDRTVGERPVRDDDGAALTALVEGCFDEYPGCVLDPDDLDADLAAPATAFAAMGGELWVVPDDEGLVACGGWAPSADEPGVAEVKRVYVAARGRRRGLAAGLVGRAERAAAAHGATRVVAWSDTRFVDAHRLYERLGYSPTARTRELHDPSHTTEREFVRPLASDGLAGDGLARDVRTTS